MLRQLLIVFTLCALAAPARADDDKIGLIHGEVAMTIAGAEDVVSASFRGYLGAAVGLGPARPGWRPWLGGGAHLGTGVLYVDDPRALDGSVELGFSTIGPEARVGLAFVDGGYVNSQLYVAAARLRVGVDPRVMLDAVDDVAGGDGTRLALGVTFADRLLARLIAEDDETRTELSFLAVFVPHAIELTWEESAGSSRVGVSFGFGI